MAWGNISNTNKGTILNNLISASDLSILNNGDPTFFRYLPDKNRHSSALDVAFSNVHMNQISWEVSKDSVGGSHHFPCLIVIKNCHALKKTSSSVFSKRQAVEAINNLAVSENILDFQNLCRVEIGKATHVKTNPRHVPKIWWSDDIQAVYDDKKRAEVSYYRNPTIANLLTFKKKRAELTRTCKLAKKKSWEDYMVHLNE